MIPTKEYLIQNYSKKDLHENVSSLNKEFSLEMAEFRKMCLEIVSLFCDIVFYQNKIGKIRINDDADGYLQKYFMDSSMDYSPISDFIQEINRCIEIEKYNENLRAIPIEYINMNIFKKSYLHNILSRIFMVLSLLPQDEFKKLSVVEGLLVEMLFESPELFQIHPMQVLDRDDAWNGYAQTIQPSRDDFAEFLNAGILKTVPSVRSVNYSNRRVIHKKLHIILKKHLKNIWKLMIRSKWIENMKEEVGLEMTYSMLPDGPLYEIGKMLGKTTPEMKTLVKHFNAKRTRKYNNSLIGSKMVMSSQQNTTRKLKSARSSSAVSPSTTGSSSKKSK